MQQRNVEATEQATNSIPILMQQRPGQCKQDIGLVLQAVGCKHAQPVCHMTCAAVHICLIRLSSQADWLLARLASSSTEGYWHHDGNEL